MEYINKKTGYVISARTYTFLSVEGQMNYIPIKDNSVTINQTHNSSIGDGIAVCAVVPALILDSLFDIF